MHADHLGPWLVVGPGQEMSPTHPLCPGPAGPLNTLWLPALSTIQGQGAGDHIRNQELCLFSQRSGRGECYPVKCSDESFPTPNRSSCGLLGKAIFAGHITTFSGLGSCKQLESLTLSPSQALHHHHRDLRGGASTRRMRRDVPADVARHPCSPLTSSRVRSTSLGSFTRIRFVTIRASYG